MKKNTIHTFIFVLICQACWGQHALFFRFQESKDSLLSQLSSINEVQKIDGGNSFRAIIAYLSNGAAAYQFDKNLGLCKVRLTRNFDNFNGAKSAFNEALEYARIMQGIPNSQKPVSEDLKMRFIINGNPYVLQLIKYGHRDYQVFLEGELNTQTVMLSK